MTLCLIAPYSPAHSASPELLSQDRFVYAESSSDVWGAGNNPSSDECLADEYTLVEASEFSAFDALACANGVGFECHTLIEASSCASQNSWFTATSLHANGNVYMLSYGYLLANMGGHVWATSNSTVQFTISEDTRARLIFSLTASDVGRATVRLSNVSTSTSVIDFTIGNRESNQDIQRDLVAGTYELTVLARGECGLDCQGSGSYEFEMRFDNLVAGEATSMGTLKARFR